MLNSSRVVQVLVAVVIAGALTACGKTEPPAATPAPTPSPVKLTAGTTETAQGVEEKQPRTDEEWAQVRKQALILAESANLLLLEGRHVAREGKQLEDHGTPGNLTAAESDKAIAADRAAFVGFGQALHDVGVAFLKASEERNPQAMMDAGEVMDQVCEGCHLKFWYPGQVIPPLPDQAPEEK
jgi:hypothetical protein